MEINYIKIIETFIVLTLYLLIKALSNKVINKNITNRLLQKSRGEIVKKGINLTLMSLNIALILIVWGVNQSDLATYIGSILTVVGVAFVAQWSILSNVTSSIIIFFNYSVKIDDMIIIMEGKEYEIEGRVIDIGLFFVTLKTRKDEQITLPNNVFIQKMIKKVPEIDEGNSSME